ncbi:MAG TPA: DUF302 domain-containing protein [Gammaproteobacteria bacterium]|nr:DUF302 domain-containing protein [Gammaproteobacteria bacterium]
MYGFNTTVSCSMDAAVEKVTTALATEGFGILTEIDVQAAMKKKLDLDTPPYLILGACNPSLAHQALEAEPDIGLLLPCNVVVREEANGTVIVAFMDPEAVLGIVGRDDIQPLAKEVKARLLRVRDQVAAGS